MHFWPNFELVTGIGIGLRTRGLVRTSEVLPETSFFRRVYETWTTHTSHDLPEDVGCHTLTLKTHIVAMSEDLPSHMCSLRRARSAFTFWLTKDAGFSCRRRRPWSDWAQVDLSLHWAHMSEGSFSNVVKCWPYFYFFQRWIQTQISAYDSFNNTVWHFHRIWFTLNVSPYLLRDDLREISRPVEKKCRYEWTAACRLHH